MDEPELLLVPGTWGYNQPNLTENDMTDLPIIQQTIDWLARSWTWLKLEILTPASLVQLAVIALVLLMGRLLGGPLRRWLRGLVGDRAWLERPWGRAVTAVIGLTGPLLALFLLAVADTTAGELGWPSRLVHTAVSLLTAWVVIRLANNLAQRQAWLKAIAGAAITVAVLNILGLWGPTQDLLDGLAVTLGGTRISALAVIKGLLVLALTLKAASLGARLLEKRIKATDALTPSVQVLLGKIARVTVYVVAVTVSLSAVGIDLTVFAFFSGAIGLGVGFGLQKVVSNLVSGIILLVDRSVKPGDMIEVGTTVGQVQHMGGRYVSVVTRDGTEFLIPNEDLITNRVTNWSYTDRLVRLKIGVGISYDADLRQARQLTLEAAGAVPRVLTKPAPVCHVIDFGDSSVDLQLRVWIKDPEKGLTNVASAIRLQIWDRFQAHDIDIPYPQQDVHFKPLPAGSPIPGGAGDPESD